MIDKLDIKILRTLNNNARKSFREIAKELNVSLSTVANRVKRMEKDGVISGYIPLVKPEALGLDMTAVITIRISHGKLLDVQRRISRDPHILAVYDVTGDWDSVLVAKFRNSTELNSFIKELLGTQYVERTNTQLVLNVVKDEKRVQI